MSYLFNQLSIDHVERITDALVAALAFTHDDLQPLGRILARASEAFFDAAYLMQYGEEELAAEHLATVRRHTVEALLLLGGPTKSADIVPNFIDVEEEA